MAQGRPIEAETRTEAVRLMTEEGWGRNRIARELGISQAAVTGIAREVDHQFDWKMTELAVRAHRIDIAEMRATLAKASLIRAFEALEAIDAPAVMVHFESGALEETIDDEGRTERKYRAGKFREHLLDAPTFADQRNLATVFGIMTQRAGELTRSLPGATDANALSMLDGLAQAMSQYVEAQGGTVDPESDPLVESPAVPREVLLERLAERAAAEDDDADAANDLP